MTKQTREQLGVKAGDKIVLKGIVSFAKIDKLVDGEELAKENQRRSQNGMIQADKPFRSISITDFDVVQGQGTPLANYYGGQIYDAKNGKPTISLESKSLYPPNFGHVQNGQIVEIADPMRNPSPGQEVYLMIEAFGSKGYARLGSSFNAIVYGEGDIKFYQSGGNSLAGFGEALNMPFVPLPPQAVATTAPAQTAPAQEQPNAFGQPQQNGFGQTNPTQGGFAQPEQTQGGFNQPVQNQGGFNQPAPTQGGFAQPQQNGFGQAPQNDPNQNTFNQGQPNTAGDPFANNQAAPQTNASPFGLQDADAANNAGNSGTQAPSPFA